MSIALTSSLSPVGWASSRALKTEMSLSPLCPIRGALGPWLQTIGALFLEYFVICFCIIAFSRQIVYV